MTSLESVRKKEQAQEQEQQAGDASGKGDGAQTEQNVESFSSDNGRDNDNDNSEENPPPQPSQAVIIPQFSKPFLAPPGWTNDPQQMCIEETYQDPESEGHDLLKALGILHTATAVLAHSPRIGGTMHIFKDEREGWFYIWNSVQGGLRRFVERDFERILVSMYENKGGTKELENLAL